MDIRIWQAATAGLALALGAALAKCGRAQYGARRRVTCYRNGEHQWDVAGYRPRQAVKLARVMAVAADDSWTWGPPPEPEPTSPDRIRWEERNRR